MKGKNSTNNSSTVNNIWIDNLGHNHSYFSILLVINFGAFMEMADCINVLSSHMHSTAHNIVYMIYGLLMVSL